MQKNKVVLVLTVMLVSILLVTGLVIAQIAPNSRGTWANSGKGVTVEVVPNVQPQDTRTFEVEGTGKNNGPIIEGETDPQSVPISCPRDADGFYSETHDIKDDQGAVVGTVKVIYNTDCTIRKIYVKADGQSIPCFKRGTDRIPTSV
jgi:hypothetical protein